MAANWPLMRMSKADETRARAQVAPSDSAQAPGSPSVFALELRDISFTYGDGTPVIASLSLRVNRGEIVSVVGPSGAGKTTLLKIAAGLLPQTSGSVANGTELPRDPTGMYGRPITVMFQQDVLLPWLTVQEHVKFGLRYLRLTKAEASQRTDSLLSLVNMLDARDKFPYQLSGGMRRRAALLMAVSVRPRILLLDEPFSSVDEPTRIRIHEEMLRIAEDLQMTVLIVTHDLGEAISLSDRVIVLTHRPATVAKEYAVPLPRPRSLMELRESPEYGQLYGQVWHALRLEIEHDTARTSSQAGASDG
jgi:NitT/TauT family transport system ATP-binding protein